MRSWDATDRLGFAVPRWAGRAGSCSAHPEGEGTPGGGTNQVASVTTTAGRDLAVAASLKRRQTRKWMTKTPGVSLIAIASPDEHPAGHSGNSLRPDLGPSGRQEHGEGVDLPGKRMPSLTGCSHSMGAAGRRGDREPGAEAG